MQGSPVEAAETPDHRFMFVSNYSMYGPGYSREGHDAGGPSSGYDKSTVYRVALDDLEIDKVIKVGSVPKYVAVTPDQKYLLVSNWISYTLSVIDVHTSKRVENVYLGPYPRGIAVSPDSQTAYVTVMGSYDIATVDLTDFSVGWIRGVGSGPRHVVMSPDGKYLYVTLNGEGNVAKISTQDRQGREEGLHRPAAAQHGHGHGRQVAVRRQLRLEHDEPGAHQGHEGDRQRGHQRAAHRHHLRHADEERVGLLLHRQHHGVRAGVGRAVPAVPHAAGSQDVLMLARQSEGQPAIGFAWHALSMEAVPPFARSSLHVDSTDSSGLDRASTTSSGLSHGRPFIADPLTSPLPAYGRPPVPPLTRGCPRQG